MKYGCGFRNVLKKKGIFNFVKEFLDGNEIAGISFFGKD